MKYGVMNNKKKSQINVKHTTYKIIRFTIIKAINKK